MKLNIYKDIKKRKKILFKVICVEIFISKGKKGLKHNKITCYD